MININANRENKSRYISDYTDAYIHELRKKVDSLFFGCEVSTFLFKYVPFLEKAIVLLSEQAAKKDYKAELHKNRCDQLDPTQNRYADIDPSQARNVSEEIELTYRSLSEGEKKNAAENVWNKIKKTQSLFCQYFNPEKHKYLIHYSIQDYLKFASLRIRSMSPKETELYGKIQAKHHMAPSRIHYCVTQLMKRHESIDQKSKQEIEEIRLQALNDLYKMNFSSSEKKDIDTFKNIIDSISLEKADKYISSECSVVDDTLSYLTKIDTIQGNDGAPLNVPHALNKDAKGGLPSFTILQKFSDGSLISSKQLELKGNNNDESTTIAHINPIINLIEFISKDCNISIDAKNELKKRTLLTLTQAYATPLINVVQSAVFDDDSSDTNTFPPSELNGYQPRIFLYDQKKRTLTICIDIRAGFTDYQEKLNAADKLPTSSPHLVGQIVVKLTISLDPNSIKSTWETVEISPLILPKDKLCAIAAAPAIIVSESE